jgi:Bifunctional DNA primase/polymerase, N-terminal
VTIIDAALEYAARGIPIVPCWGVHIPDDAEIDGVTEVGWCLCPAGKDCKKSPGKHPRFDLAPHGVHDATLNAADIALWPTDINIAAALGKGSGGLMVNDVDHTPTANLLTHPTVGLSDRTAVAITPKRGIHAWFTCRGDTSSYNVRKADGTKLGEVRGDGLYALLPPSRGLTGKYYRWLGRQVGDYDMPPTSGTTESFPFVTDLYAAVEVEIKERRGEAAAEPLTGSVEECGIPEAIRLDPGLTQWRQRLAGLTDPLAEADRSGMLWALAMCMKEAAYNKGYAISAQEIAGVVKKFDRTCFTDPKFAGRADADDRYWTTATEVLRSPENPNGSAAQLQPQSQPQSQPLALAPPALQGIPLATPVGPQPDYIYDPTDGWLYLRLTRSLKKVCNFQPQILEDVEVYVGDGEAHRSWRVRLTLLEGKSVEFVLHSRQVETPQTLEKTLARECDPDFKVAAGMYGHVKAALLNLSAGWKATRAFAATGWVENGERWLYLLPGSTGAIGEDGIDPSVSIDIDQLPDDIQPTMIELSGYGRSVRPFLSDVERHQAWEAFRLLVECGPSHVTIPVVLQVLAGPLAGRGADSPPPLVHLTGKTGSYKTGYSLCAISLFGQFKKPPASWSWTPTSWQAYAAAGRNLTLLYDDFKMRHVRSKDRLTEFIQNYADRTGRQRGRQDGSLGRGKTAKALILSNGEDTWETDASVAARTIIVDVVKGDLQLSKIKDLDASHIKTGRLQLFGGTYVAWLAKQAALMDGTGFLPLAERCSTFLLARSESGVHARLISSMANLLAVSNVVDRFIAETFGAKAGEWFRARVLEAVPRMVTGVAAQAVEVEEASPLNAFLTVLREAMAAREVTLLSRQGVEEVGSNYIPPLGRTTEIVGFWSRGLPSMGNISDDPTQYAILTKGMTYSWLCKRLRREGGDVGFSWTALYKEAIEAGYPKVAIRVFHDGRRYTVKGFALPVIELTGENAE